MSDAIKKLEGVELVQVKLNSGKALLDLKRPNGIELNSVRKAVASRGFQPGAASVIFRGSIQESEGHTVCNVLGVADSFTLSEPPAQHPNGDLWIEGTITSASDGPVTLTILRMLDAAENPPPLRIRDLVLPPAEKQ